MLTVSNDVKAKLKSDVCRKELRITVGSTVCTNSDIYNDSFELTESIMDSKVEFVGCISSILKATISTTKLPKANLQGQTVEAEVAVYLDDNTLSAYIPLFHGFVDSCETSADGHWQNLVCYDCLAYLTDTPIYNAYKKAFNGGSITLAAFRSAIFTAIGIGQEIQTLPNDAVKFRKRYRNKDLTALALIRHITQINGAFGIINRDEYFEYKYIDDSAAPEDIPYYRSLEYANTTITPINTGGLTIRTNPNDAGVTVDWTNYQQYAGTDPDWNDETQDDYLVDDDDEDISEGNYVIEGNLIAYKLKKSKKQVIAANIMDAIGHDAVFRQYKVVCNGLPYIECGDKVRFTKADSSQIGFVVFKRTLKGVQAMTDTYECMPSQEVVTNVDTSGGSGGITPQTVNADASYVSNISATTQSMGPDDALLGLIEKSVTANGTYAANDDGAEGYSQVTVDVSGGGEIPGEIITAEVYSPFLRALDKVSVFSSNGSTDTAAQIQSQIPANANVAYSDSDIYFSSGTSIYKVPMSNPNATPELWKTLQSVGGMRNNFIYDNTAHIVYNVKAGTELENVTYVEFSNITAAGFPALCDGKWGVVTAGGGFSEWTTRPSWPITANSCYVRQNGGYANQVKYSDGAFDPAVGHSWLCYAGITVKNGEVYGATDDKLIKFAPDGATFDIVYDGIGGNIRVDVGDTQYTPIWWATGASGGLITSNGKQYSNITGGTSTNSAAFSHYFWDGLRLWDLSSSVPPIMIYNGGERTPTPPSGYSLIGLGYSKGNYVSGDSGQACVLFS